MKEIGSIFPIFDFNQRKAVTETHDTNEIRFSLCREALLYVAESSEVTRKVVLLPAYTCQTVIDPFVQDDWECHFYGIKKNLRIDSDSFIAMFSQHRPTIVVFHPFYGRGFNNRERDLIVFSKSQDAITIVDVTQSIFLNKEYNSVDYYVGSYRKWLPIPDGGFVYSGNRKLEPLPDSLEENEEFCVLQRDAMYLRGLYFDSCDYNTKQISIRLNKRAEGYVSHTHIICHKMSAYSQAILNNEFCSEIQKRRMENIAFLLSRLKESRTCKCIIKSLDELESAPLYFPIYTEDRARCQAALAANKIYAPILWPVEDERLYVNNSVRYIYDHILLMPIDQRYNRVDMQRIIDTICFIETEDE